MAEFAFREGRANHARFRQSPEVMRWNRELSLRSKLTADGYVRRLALFCDITGISPAELVRRARARPDSVRRLLSDYAVAQQGRGRSPAYIRKVLFALRSWLDHNGVEFTRLPKIGGRDGVTIENERVPSAEDLRRLLGVLSARGRVCALLMAQSGVRPGVLGAIDASDGLRLGDLPEFELTKLEFARVPFVVRVRSTRDKTGKGYLTFGGPELAEAILAYLHERVARGETLTPDSPLVGALGSGVGREGKGPKPAGTFVSTKSITEDLREGIHRSGLSFRPYVLRARFATACLLGEQHGTVTRDVREFWMGHELGSVQNRYTLGKRLTDETIEAMRSAYERTVPFVSVLQVPRTSNEEVYKVILEMAGLDGAEVDKLGPLNSEVVLEALHRAREASESAGPPAVPGQQKVVDVTAAEAWIGEGWRFVAPLNGSKVVIQAPE
ncbi:MAG TPA: hypothetical protein VMG99_08440 [Thermoplasmata archaeon]|nr:hypothetical protein [Thermoplasmata archaeon]